jgi:hypothetical protein
MTEIGRQLPDAVHRTGHLQFQLDDRRPGLRIAIEECIELHWHRRAVPALGPCHAHKYNVFGDGCDRPLPLAVIALQLRNLASLAAEVIGIVHRSLDLPGARRPASVAGGGDHVAIVANPNWIGRAASGQQQGDENCVAHDKPHFAFRLHPTARDGRPRGNLTYSQSLFCNASLNTVHWPYMKGRRPHLPIGL